MASCYRRIAIGPTALNIPVQRPKSRYPVEIPVFPSRSYNNQFSFGIALRPRNCERVEAVRPEGRSEGGADADKVGPGPGPGRCFYSVEDRTVEVEKGERNRAVEVVVAAAMTVVFGVGNRVLYKLALVPLKRYPFFLAQLATFGYVVVYFSVMYLRYHAGIVTDEMLSMPKVPFLGVGLLEALATVTGMAAGAILSGASITIFSQTFLVWQILLSIVFLGRRYRVNHLLGCFLVAAGVIITVASGSSTGHSLKEAGIFWSLMMIVSFLLQAAGTVLKEVIFLDGAQRLKGGSVDLFVVNSYGSAFQALFIGLLLPFLPKLWGIPFSQLANYLKDGAACFLNIGGTLSSGCNGAPLLPLLFVIVNIGFNISLLHLLKISSAVVSSLASTFSVPISVYIFTLPLPYLGVASPLPTGFVAGAIVLVTGLLIYAWSPSGSSSALPSPPT
ncbi:CRT (chloroquine-resistance transporter)-like transporter 3 [Hibiscus trionum]|uniref:CRT (Chloroquine-resistance transporter)-like transporter 3 n=1 Tax=Hibiscus trionum TaxID=183268 RepID=A0A9W7JHK7_HIBTR|nr:CRT (chloroquine-resistance transporter)-like transporter 3 [Hibiscus trionum]